MSDAQSINDMIVPALPTPEPKKKNNGWTAEVALPAVAMVNPSLDRIQSFVVKPRSVIDVTGLSI